MITTITFIFMIRHGLVHGLYFGQSGRLKKLHDKGGIGILINIGIIIVLVVF